MARRWIIVAAVVLVVVMGTVGALLAFSGGHHSPAVAGPVASATVSPALTATPSATTSPTPRPSGAHRRRATASHASVRPVRAGHAVGQGSSGSQADPCAHNHHCYVPPAPDPKPDFKPPPVGKPSITITGAPVPPPGGDN